MVSLAPVFCALRYFDRAAPTPPNASLAVIAPTPTDTRAPPRAATEGIAAAKDAPSETAAVITEPKPLTSTDKVV